MLPRRARFLLAVAACAALLAVAGGGLAGPAAEAETDADPVTVAVVDSGIDDSHPALAGRVAERVDLTGPEPTHPETGVDENGHGTFVAGVAAAAADDRPVEFVDVRVVDEGGWTADDAAVAAGIEYAADGGADVILLSLTGVGDDDRMEAAVARATDGGAVVVASAGNRNRTRGITPPGTARGAITVGATDDGELWERSARGPTLAGAFKPELVAPGVATGPQAGGDGDTRMRGTSVAAAEVAGVAAGVVSDAPDLGPAGVEARLTSTARPLGDRHVVGSGSGELDADRALDPDIVTDGVVDLGVVDGAERGTVTVANRGDRRHELVFEPTLENIDTGVDATDALELDRHELSLAPGESATLELTAEPPESGAYAGELRYSVDGTPRAIAVGAFAGGTVTVDKRALSPDGEVDGDELLVFTENDTHTELLEFEDGTAEFLGGGGSYVLWSSGVDDPTGSLVMLSERLTVEGDTYVRLDEADTVRAGVDATALESAYGPLENRSVTASMRTRKGDGAEHLSRGLTDADARTVRVSPDPDTELVTTYLLAPEAGLGGADVFHLENRVGAARWATPRAVTPDGLESTTYRVGRTTVDRFPEIQERATVTGGYNSRQLAWFEPTARSTQTVHHTPGIDHERRLRMDGWRAELDASGGGVALSHPFVAVADVDVADGTASIEARPLADGAGTRLHTDGEHAVTVTGGDHVTERRGDDPVFEFDAEAAAGEPFSVRVEGDNPGSRLSTHTLTELSVTDPAGPIPTIRDLRLPEATRAGAAGPGAVTLRIDADNPTAIEDATVWYAAGEPEDPPWVDGAGWERTPAGAGYGSLRASLDVPKDAGRVSLAAELETDAGNVARTATTAAFHAGSAPNTSTRHLGGRLATAAGEPADNDTVVASRVDGDSSIVAETDAEGRFELEVPKDERYELTYRRGDLWDGDAPAPDRPDLLALGRLNASADVDREWTLPEPTRLDVAVDDARGEPVANATVRLAHRGEGATSAVELETDANGTVALGASPAIHLGGSVELAVTPPDAPAYLGETRNRTVELGGGTAAERVVVDTEPPTAAVSASRTWMLHGTPTTLNATEADVPAGAAEYRWDLDGDGTADRVTAAPTLRYEPAPGVSEPSVTVVDRAGKRATADAGPIRVDERG